METFSSLQNQYPAGLITIDSSNIWDYLVYNKDVGSEFSRLQRQDILLKALFTAIPVNHSLGELRDWLQNSQYLMTTDMDPDQLLSTFCALGYSEEGSFIFEQIPVEYFTINPASITIVDPDQVIDFINQQFSIIQ